MQLFKTSDKYFKVDADTLIFSPTISAPWQSYGFKLFYAGALIAVKVTHDEAVFRIREGPTVQVGIYDQQYQISAKPLHVKIRPTGGD